ncbi:MAG: HAD family phosphatase, partial [Bacteroidales bacterium]|nr:HAD family phosphatase [Bacteroidales bacterium]
MQNKIKNIIFDFGGVVFHIEEQRTIDAFARLYQCSDKQVLEYLFANDLFLSFECGKISARDFITHLQSLAPHPVTQEQILSAWNAILVGYPPEHIPLLLALKKNYRTFLLSNTNELHTIEFPKIAQRQQLGIQSNYDMFEKVWYSNEIGMRKPNPEIFKFVLQDAGLVAEETLFVDDLAENVAAASTIGIHTMQITKDNGIV